MKKLFLILNLAPIFLAGCSHSVEQICSGELQNFEVRISQASQTLSQRAPASEQRDEDWKEWAVDRLKETQAALDHIDEHPSLGPLKEDLSWIADQWVTFHGLAVQGDRSRMSEILARIVHREQAMREKTCSAPRNPA